MFRAPCAHHQQEVKIALHSLWYYQTYRWPSGAQVERELFHNKFISCLYMFRAHVLHHQEIKIALHSLWYHHTYRWPSGAQVERQRDDTRGCVM